VERQRADAERLPEADFLVRQRAGRLVENRQDRQADDDADDEPDWFEHVRTPGRVKVSVRRVILRHGGVKESPGVARSGPGPRRVVDFFHETREEAGYTGGGTLRAWRPGS